MTATMHDAEPSFADLFPEASHADWLKRVEAVLKGADFDKSLVARSHDGIAIQPLHARRPDAPLVAGADAGKPWRIAMRVDHPEAEAAASLAREDLEGGADALALVFAGGHAARGFGLPCKTVSDLDETLAGVHLDLVSMRLDPAPAGHVNALLIAALVEKRKLNPAQMRIDFGLDPIASLMLLGHVPWDWDSMSNQLVETILSLQGQGFNGPFLTVDLRLMHEAGAGEGQELTTALAQGVLYLRALEAHGLELAEAFKAISFILPVDGNQIMGLAKLRALRKLWAKVTEACNQQPVPVLIHAETSWRMLTRRDPYVNILRNTIAAFAAGVGGADTLTVLPYTQALGLPDAAARRLARNTSLVLQEEASLWRVVDPSAGAGGFEAITDALAETAWTLFQEMESEGGLLASLVQGKLQRRISETAQARARSIANRKESLTGSSTFANLDEVSPTVLDIQPVTNAHPKQSGKLSITPLVSHRLAAPFEALRDRTDAMLAHNGQRPCVRLVTLGALVDHAARLAFTQEFFALGGMEAVVDAAPTEVANGVIFCLVGTDAAYAESAAPTARRLAASGHTIWLAGRPSAQESALREAGVSRFVFAGCDIVEALDVALNTLEKT